MIAPVEEEHERRVSEQTVNPRFLQLASDMPPVGDVSAFNKIQSIDQVGSCSVTVGTQRTATSRGRSGVCANARWLD